MCFSNNSEAPPPPPPPPAAPLTVDGESPIIATETTKEKYSGPSRAFKKKKRNANIARAQASRKTSLASIQKKKPSYSKGAQANMSKRG